MTTTNEQKAGILVRWRDHRLARGLTADVEKQLEFNWPSFKGADRKEVLRMVTKSTKAAERKMFVVEIAKGGKSLEFKYKTVGMAAALVEMVAAGGKWKNETELVKGDVTVKSKDLEVIMEAEPSRLGEEEKADIAKWLGRKSAGKVDGKAADGMVTLAMIGENIGKDPRAIRIQLRAQSKIQQTNGRWEWPADEADRIEKEIAKLMRV